ncbi:MAG TPA: flagellar export chaperone FliS [bacterium]|nr:flagellar export chaperone FliS [bacterium]
MLKGYGGYTQAYQKVAVNTVDQRKLILMLYDGAIKFLTQGVERMRAGEIFEAHNNLIRGKSIIAELLASLNLEAGGEIAQNLQRLYAYMFNALIDANLNKDASRVEHVVHLLKELRAGWQGAKGADPKAAAPAPTAGQAGGGVTKHIQVKG